ncbi:ribose-5-phosphate isomerase [Austwickia chelonae]|uniref:Ribose-5-phosphate isomerase B n=1 Tax=Austwickia chelonae NBRC 105200 TaxID=1184607 RepID=K6VPW9_9MICO|nr:ribose 5-phosphate isomerase B [Austwickia chelonae]GAB78794.1 ribose-5-phosphate isomerase B [Austwickia chelonae NBRC 105200]SEV84365.1 ribose-5-phosphate isomerase [Austwickia chelonae]
MKIGIGNDHGAYQLRLAVKAHLEELGHEVVDFGSDSAERVDYPDYGHAVGKAVVAGEIDLGIVMCGTGIGIGLAANKVSGVRCAIVSEPYSARLARQHNDANMLALGGRVVAPEYATMIVDEFLTAQFEGGRHAQRVALIERF